MVSDDTRTLEVQRRSAPAPSVAGFVITVTSGPDTGVSLTLDGSEPSRVLVGQSPACALRLTDQHVSRRHVSLEATERGIRLHDLGSRNGTWYQGAAVVDATLDDGQAFTIGASTLQIQRATDAREVVLSDATSFGRVFGASYAMRRLYPLCERIARSDIPVVIEGETGTGKEFLAEAIHEASARAQAPFIVFDCTTVAPNLVESALFGHEKGAFTSAVSQRKGVFELAHGGTLLIDEIGDLDPTLQPKLLRALERLEIQRVGGDRFFPVDVRVLAATRRDLDREVQEGRFREDLFFRLAVGRIELPPLRERHGDVGLLARHFWRKMSSDDASIPDALLARFEAHDWPGNIRELRNAVARAIALGDLDDRGRSSPSLPPPSASQPPPPPPVDEVERMVAEGLPLAVARAKVVEAFERRYVERMLDKHGGNVTRAASAAGIARRYFYTLKSRLGM